MIGSLNATVIGITVPTPYVPVFCVEDTSVTVGAVVSMTIFAVFKVSAVVSGVGNAKLAWLPAASSTVPPLSANAAVEV